MPWSKSLLEPVVTVLPGAGVVLQSAAVTVTRSPRWEIVAVSAGRDRWLADNVKVSVDCVPTLLVTATAAVKLSFHCPRGHYAR